MTDAATMRLEGIRERRALVTGAGRGIGRRVAEVLRDLGAVVVAGDIDLPSIENLHNVQLDVTNEESVEAAFQWSEDSLGGAIEILVLNAGVFQVRSLEDTTLEAWRRTMAVNLDGAFLCLRRAIAGMRRNGFGRVVAIGSSAGITGGSVPCADYAASKAGLMAMIKSAASQFAADGVTANSLAPALIRTDMMKDIASLSSRVPVGRVGEPDDIAALVAFLASSHSSYITGEVIDINGGFFID